MQPVLIIGGNSRLGKAIVAQPDFVGQSVVRSGKVGIEVKDYAELSSGHMSGFQTVINLTGLVSGSESELRNVNTELSSHLAQKAKKAGVRNFVQISSFSIFGGAELINSATRTEPQSTYGRSRLEGEVAVTALADQKFSVMLARLPMLYGKGDSKLERLVNTWLRIGKLPVPLRPVRRSMIHYDLAAEALFSAITHGMSGPVAFADAEPFEYNRAARALSRGSGKSIGLVRVPAAISALANFVPSVRRSLYSDSLLSDNANVVVRLGLESRLYNDLADMAAEVRS